MERLAAMLQETFLSEEREPLSALVDLFVRRGAHVDLAAWQHAIRITRLHAGIFLAGGLTGLGDLLTTDDDELSANDKLAHALPFAVSAAHRTLRAQTGMALGTPPTTAGR